MTNDQQSNSGLPRADSAATFAAERFGVPAPRAETASPSIPGLPTERLRDSLTAKRGVLGEEAARWIKERAEEEAGSFELHRRSEEELRAGRPARDPFATLPRAPRRDPNALREWWHQNGPDAVRTVAIERQLIDRACRGYAALAEREADRRGVAAPNPLAAVREARGEEFAAKVERHAAVLASNLDSMSERDRQVRTAALQTEIRRTGLDKAPFRAVAQAVALQHSRNVANEQEAAVAPRDREVDAGAEVAAGPDVEVAIDAGADIGPGLG